MNDETVRAHLTIHAPVEQVFATLADPTTHGSIDGTGWVQEAVDTAPLSEVGQVFRMGMYHPNHPDGDYEVANQVHVFESPDLIGWRPGTYEDGELTFGGWTWHYELRPIGQTETAATQIYAWSAVQPHVREYIDFPPFAPDHLSNSLIHLAGLLGVQT
ncbi:hypothetical protein [Gordonia soli]|uniref:Polyketide cyclase n=1 Tax=Gordonia soli NBRC 108243 TaxID=1223545 RepID=M0QGQ0_9ACTN|nr:hypothetical protein [Gordonia soli]GAC67466.1 hypothetical protein GS4_08_00500 [Gordonia soli NBRC 108243]